MEDTPELKAVSVNWRKRPGQREQATQSRISAWVKLDDLFIVDQAIQKLMKANPDLSRSQVICKALVTAAKKVK